MLVLLDFRLQKSMLKMSVIRQSIIWLKKYEANSLLKRKFAEAVALEQGDAFIATILETKQNSDEGNIVPEELTELLKAFTKSDSFRK